MFRIEFRQRDAAAPPGILRVGRETVRGRKRAFREQPASREISHQFEIDGCACKRVRGAAPGEHPVRRLCRGGVCRLQMNSDRLEAFIVALAQRSDGACDIFDQRTHGATAVQPQFSPREVHRLDAVGAFVDRRDSRIAVMLRGAGFLDESHSAMHLHGDGRHLHAHVRAPRLGDGREKFLAQLRIFARAGVLRGERQIGGHGGRKTDRAAGFDLRLHLHQHAPHVGMIEQTRRVFSRPRRAALPALQRKIKRLLIRAFGDRDALHADLQPRRVHHREHVGETVVRRADEFRVRAAVDHRAGGRAVDAELVFDAARAQFVGDTQRAILSDKPLRGEEHRNAPAAFGRIGKPGQHEMDDVLGHVVIAPGDEDLLARQPIEAVSVRLRARAKRREIRTRLRLGEVHRSGPFTGDELRQIERLLALRAVFDERFDRALRQHRTQAERHIGAVHHLEHRNRQRARQALSAMLFGRGQRIPAAVGEGAIGLRKSRRRAHRAVLILRTDLVARAVEGSEHSFREPAARIENRGQRVVVETRKCTGGGEVSRAHDLAEREGDIPCGRAPCH